LFIIYRPDISKAEISGSFTGWQPRTMNRIGDSGYWEVELALPGGEHRFSYILEGRRHIADPTVLIREKDDFGGENSILSVSL
jgi:1,4-alpha-glucan branching enzyme